MNIISTFPYPFLNLPDTLEFPTSEECAEKECGSPCSEGLCDGNGFCVSAEENPCAVHGCEEKKCGDSCLSGDIVGVCDADGECNFDIGSVLGGQCGTFFILNLNWSSYLN